MYKLDPKAVWMFYVRYLILYFFAVGFLYLYLLPYLDPSIEAYGLDRNDGVFWVMTIIALILILAVPWVWAKLSYRFYRYELRVDGFRKESGVLWKKYVTIPYERIQNIDIFRGPIDRMFGLSELHIQTAGISMGGGRWSGRMAEGQLPGLSPQVAEQLRDELVKRSKQSAGKQGL